jgi:hypothetical protein
MRHDGTSEADGTSPASPERGRNQTPRRGQHLSRRRWFISVFCGVLFPLGACGTSAIGVDICDSITSAQCTQAYYLGCGADSGTNLAQPPHPDNNLSACVEFYKVACLHGLVTPTLPEGGQVTECVSFIQSLRGVEACSLVANPQSAEQCAWLIPPEAGAEAEAEAAATDAADATVDADAADAG